MDCMYLDSFEQIGGRGFWSDAIYGLVDFSRERPGKTLVLMEWGFNTQLLALGSGTVRKIEFQWSYERRPTQEDFERLYELVKDSSNLFVFHAPKYLLDVDSYQLFFRVVDSAQMELSIAQTFYQRDGDPVIIIYEVRQTSVGCAKSLPMPNTRGRAYVFHSEQPAGLAFASYGSCASMAQDDISDACLAD